MKGFHFRASAIFQKLLFVAVFIFAAGSVIAQTQSSAADLTGTVTDPNGASVAGAIVTAKSSATGIVRTVTSGADGSYQIIGLPPGEYEVTTEATNFKKAVISPITLTVGQAANLTIKLEIGAQDVVVNVSGSSVELIETTRTSVASTISQQTIENLPINERSATGFALTLSTVGRDNGRPIGPAPTSGLNIGGQRGRSTLVQVDGADFTDNSINAARSTVSQEAVQEYQVASNSYAAEFGRATGGIVNVVTKRGTNNWNGNIFGFIRDKSIQARAPFAPSKSAFTRTQAGATIGGPIVKDKAFIFMSFERRQRNESGFFTSEVARGLTGSVTVGAPFLPFTQTFRFITPTQATQAQALLATNPSAALQYLYLASSGGYTALTGSNPLLSIGGTIPAGSQVGPRFVLSGAPVPAGTMNTNGDLIAFRALNNLQRVFPIYERSNYFTTRGDVNINANNQLTLRFGYNPSELTGIQVESQNQSLGQNDFSRTGITEVKDYSFTAGLNSSITPMTSNEFRFSYGRRNTSFRSQGSDAVAFNISGTAFIGRELFSPVDRTENRVQIANNYNWVAGDHTMKFGLDMNWVDIPSALFELNFAGLFNFGDTTASNLNTSFAGLDPFTPVQSYGLGLPSNFIQGFGNPISQIKNRPLAFFLQDSWKATSRLTLNFGIRYDVEFTETIQPVDFRDPLSGINLPAASLLAAQDVIGVQQGFPRDTNNWAPRFGFAYDVMGDGKTVVRGALGLFYDHPLLAVAFNSDIADAAQQQQSVLTAAGGPAPTSLINATQVFQGTVCHRGAATSPFCAAFYGANPAANSTPGVATTANYQFGRQRFDDQTFIGYSSVLPFTLPVSKDFKYASATQANITVERQVTSNMSFSGSYIFVGAHNLPHPNDINAPQTNLQIQNFQRFFGGALPASTTQAVAFSIATTAPGTATGVGCFVVIPGMVAQCPNGRVVAPAIANFFRPNAPNYFLASALSGGAVSKAVLDSQLVGSLRTTGALTPFGAVNAQVSDGNSIYHALNLELKSRFANNFAFLASYTLSKSEDDSSDLQTLLIPQDTKRFDLERSASLFDQRHRFVFSGMYTTPTGWRTSDSIAKLIFADFTIAPILEISSGKPFNIITNVDSNNDQSSQTDRPRVLANGTLCAPGADPGCGTIFATDANNQTVFATGDMGRNRGRTHGYASLDLRISRAFHFGERIRLDLIAEGFNLFNRFNEASASPNYKDVNAFGQTTKGNYFSLPTAAYDQRQFQFGAKLFF